MLSSRQYRRAHLFLKRSPQHTPEATFAGLDLVRTADEAGESLKRCSSHVQCQADAEQISGEAHL